MNDVIRLQHKIEDLTFHNQNYLKLIEAKEKEIERLKKQLGKFENLKNEFVFDTLNCDACRGCEKRFEQALKENEK